MDLSHNKNIPGRYVCFSFEICSLRIHACAATVVCSLIGNGQRRANSGRWVTVCPCSCNCLARAFLSVVFPVEWVPMIAIFIIFLSISCFV